MAFTDTVAIHRTGMVASVGRSSTATCAAIRAKLTNPTETAFIDSSGARIMAHEVRLERPWRGITKIARMAAMAIEDCLGRAAHEISSYPTLLCVAESGRPGRPDGLDRRLFSELESILGVSFSADSALVPLGRVGALVALERARKMICAQGVKQVLIVAADSFLTWPTLSHFEQRDRLLTESNSNGFMPGEGACAFLIARPRGGPELLCAGIGFGRERAHIESDEPLRGEGLGASIRAALEDAGCEMHDVSLRIADISGEQYYFKEAALALNRLLRRRKEELDLWHPAESTGEAGAMSGAAPLVVADAACRKEYAPGTVILAHMANDAGERAAAVLQYRAK